MAVQQQYIAHKKMKTKMALSRMHASSKAADPTKMLVKQMAGKYTDSHSI